MNIKYNKNQKLPRETTQVRKVDNLEASEIPASPAGW